MPKPIIIVTGFGPFVGHEERNASWEAVRLLPDRLLFKNDSYEIRKLEVPVTYEAVDRIVPLIWAAEPSLVVHVGVHGGISTINLEHGSYTTGYCKPDFANRCLPCDKITLHGKEATSSSEPCPALTTNLDIERIAQELNLETNTKCCCSTEVGNYLCGYIYLKSLDVDPDRTLFVHVPNIGKPYTSEETKATLYRLIEKCLDDLATSKKLI
ncbi:pyroglutamyl-peptidase 1 [Anopheles aquasalis]|uniref:pyroglutamyl-peptidase 1 n=1 Tax=Anopheles aquasalis TaxID=42839 RepID=UPI00215A5034|nr:pyroglutamyl-peptidase 1 [Anopheles aquasalis]